jgi:hypothetical protein
MVKFGVEKLIFVQLNGANNFMTFLLLSRISFMVAVVFEKIIGVSGSEK